MDALDRALIQRTLTENAQLERSGQLLLALAVRMQQVTDLRGQSLDLPALAIGCNDTIVEMAIRQLDQAIAQVQQDAPKDAAA